MDLKLSTVYTIAYDCFVLHNFCERNKSRIDEEPVQKEIDSMKLNEKLYKNIPDPIYSYDGGGGKVVQNILTSCIRDKRGAK